MLSFRQLQYLVAVADKQHFRRAASHLNVAQPTLSLQLQKLEAQLGTKLVERGRGPVALTPMGREIVARSRKLLVDLQDLEAFAHRGTGEPIGTVSLGVSPTIGPYLLPGVIRDLRQSMPEVKLHIREGVPSEQKAELRSGMIDLMLSSSAPAGDDMHVEPLFSEHLHLVAPPEHPLHRSPTLTRADLVGYQMLSIDSRYPFHAQAGEICAELGLELLSNYEGTSLDSICQMCASGLGLAVLPQLYLLSDVGGKNVVRPLKIGDWSSSRSVVAVWRVNSVYHENYLKISGAIIRESEVLLGRTK